MAPAAVHNLPLAMVTDLTCWLLKRGPSLVRKDSPSPVPPYADALFSSAAEAVALWNTGPDIAPCSNTCMYPSHTPLQVQTICWISGTTPSFSTARGSTPAGQSR